VKVYGKVHGPMLASSGNVRLDVLGLPHLADAQAKLLQAMIPPPKVYTFPSPPNGIDEREHHMAGCRIVTIAPCEQFDGLKVNCPVCKENPLVLKGWAQLKQLVPTGWIQERQYKLGAKCTRKNCKSKLGSTLLQAGHPTLQASLPMHVQAFYRRDVVQIGNSRPWDASTYAQVKHGYSLGAFATDLAKMVQAANSERFDYARLLSLGIQQGRFNQTCRVQVLNMHIDFGYCALKSKALAELIMKEFYFTDEAKLCRFAMQGVPYQILSGDRHYKEVKHLEGGKETSGITSITTNVENSSNLIVSMVFNVDETYRSNEQCDASLVRIVHVGLTGALILLPCGVR
jgi:hypothetical protein